MFELILNRFAAVGEEGSEILSADDMESSPPEQIAVLKELGLVKKATPARIVECRGCEEACLMPVHVYLAQDGRPARIFIACDKREDAGHILIEPATLEQWQIDISKFASLLATSLGTGHVPDEIIPKKAFYLGSLTINRKRRSAIFVVNNDSLNLALEAGLPEQYPHPFFLVAAGLHGPQDMKQGQVVPLSHVLLSSANGLAVDLEDLGEALSAKNRVRHDVIPFSVPASTEWKHVFISFVNEQTVQIKGAGKTEHRSFDEMGFSDLRAGANESRPSELWGVFQTLAKYRGDMTFQDSIETFDHPEKVKKWVSQIRKKLRHVFPDIHGDPFHPYNKVKGYKTRFSLNTSPTSM